MLRLSSPAMVHCRHSLHHDAVNLVQALNKHNKNVIISDSIGNNVTNSVANVQLLFSDSGNKLIAIVGPEFARW